MLLSFCSRLTTVDVMDVFCTVVILSLMPGLRKHGVLKDVTDRVKGLIDGLRKPKTS